MGQSASIPGGDRLVAQSYAQTVIGHHNRKQGTSTPTTINRNDRLFIVGNGTSANVPDRSNAFEVSDNGHSIVYHTNGTGGATPPGPGHGAIYGATYRDNIIYAWGDIEGTPSGPSTIMTSNGDFGVQAITGTTGRYIVTLNTVDPYTGAAIPSSFSNASITATIVNTTLSPKCYFVNVTPLGAAGLAANQFAILITDASCNRIDSRVSFKVCGRD